MGYRKTSPLEIGTALVRRGPVTRVPYGKITVEAMRGGAWKKIANASTFGERLSENVEPLKSIGKRAGKSISHFGKTAVYGAIGIGAVEFGAYVVAGALYSHYMKKARRHNRTHNRIKGKQASKNAVAVPFHSPWEGPQVDLQNAEAPEDRNKLHHLAPFAAPFVGQKIFEQFPRRWQENIYLATRFMEDATPFRIGRIFGLSGKFSSFLTPEAGINVGISRLLSGARRLTPYGGTFARALGMQDKEFVSVLEKRLAGGEKSLQFLKSRGPWMKMVGSDFELRFFESTNRLAQSYATYGAAEAEVRPGMRAAYVEQRVREMLGYGKGPLSEKSLLNTFDWQTHVARFIHNQVPGGKAALERFASIPKWDKNAIKWLQRSGAEQDLWTPGYQRGMAGWARAGGGRLFDFFRSGWGLLRSGAAFVGVDLGPATNLRSMGIKAGKFGLLAYAGVKAFSYTNETLHGGLTAPFWNIYEHARLTQARISDKLGFTDIRKQHPHIYPWAVAALAAPVVGLPAIALGAAKYLRRATYANWKEMTGTAARMRAGQPIQWQSGGKASMGMRDLPFDRAGLRVESWIARSRYVTHMVDEYGQVVKGEGWKAGAWAKRADRIAIMNAKRAGRILHRELTPLAKFAGAAWLGIAATLFAPFILGTKYSEEEYQDIFSGKKPIPVKRGRFWEFGNTPYEGGRTSYFRLHQSARRKLRADLEVPGGGRRSILKSLFDPYWREKEAYRDRPYPITGAPFEEVPFIGPLLSRTIGRFFKPPKLMHTNEFRAGQGYEPFGNDLAPAYGLGGLRAPHPMDPLGAQAQVREAVYKAGEFMGLRGFFFQSMLFQQTFGGQAPYANAAYLEPSRFKNFTNAWYESEVGGMGGSNELFRRLFPRPQRGTEVNPLRNRMPHWMPGEDYFVNFKEGDPYGKVPYGEDRLPGAGFEARYPQLKGLNPEQYPSWAKFQILADVAPWSVQTRIQRSLAYKDFGEDPSVRSHLEEIDWQMEQVKRKKDFSNYDFNRDTETISGRVSEVMPTGEFKLEQYPNHLFKPAGLRFGVNATATMLRNINGYSKEKADRVAFEQQGQAQQFLQDTLQGQQVKLKIPVGGMSRPDVEARIFADGVNINRTLAKKGLAAPEGAGAPTAGFTARLYGKAIEGLAHMPQKVPGPFFGFSKFMNEADPIEEYQRSVLYGSSSRMWNKPWENFIRPYALQTAAKLTPGEFVPGHTQKQRDIDVAFDRLNFLKSVQAGGTGGRTAAGMNPMGAEQVVTSAMPYRERPYMQEFIKETDPRRRRQILAMVSGDMQRALEGQWSKQQLEASGQGVPASPARLRTQQAMELAAGEIEKGGYKVPGQNWIGWNQGVELEDVKAVFLRHQGIDAHDYNIWDDRNISLNRKPYLHGSDEYLTSRPMESGPSILSGGFDRRLGKMSMVSEHISRFRTSKVTQYNAVDRRPEDTTAYVEAKDSLLATS